MLALFRALPLLWRLATLAGVLAALLGGVGAIYAYVRHEGYVDGYAKASAECEADQRRQELANRNAIDAANRRLVELADQLELKELLVDDYVKAIDLTSAADPRAAEQCLGIDSVRRINAIR